MKIQQSTLSTFIAFSICLLLSMVVSAATAPDGDGADIGPGFTHANYFTSHTYTGTESCLGSSCHDNEASDVLTTGHWKWQGIATNVVGVENEVHGKNDFINNFCVAVPTNEGRCAQCHIGYGYIDQTFDFTDVNKIDCLICHDQSASYVKGIKTGGLPDPTVDLQVVARSVGDNGGVPGRTNCIFCHANAGGGDNIKHGDLSMSLAGTTREFDVHMGTDGEDMSCVACHDVDRNSGGQVTSHGIGGMPFHSVDEGTMKQCVDCHDDTSGLHTGDAQALVESHDRLACQVCHIPAIARNTSTKVEWYWSEAGDLARVPVLDEDGRPDYSALKGEFVWAKDVRPTLRFHNGKWNKAMIVANDIMPDQPLDLASPAADRDDPDAMIYPFKKMIGNQPADSNNDTVLVPHLFGTVSGPNPYWGTWDWNLALWDAFNYPTGQTYTGEYGFVETEMLLSVNHEIAPREASLGANNYCSDCHAEGVVDWPALGWKEDPYMPDYDLALDSFTPPGNIVEGKTKRLTSMISNGGPDIAEGTITVVGESDGLEDIVFSEAFAPIAPGGTLKQWFDFTAPAVDSRVVVNWTATVVGDGDTTSDNNTATGSTNVNPTSDEYDLGLDSFTPPANIVEGKTKRLTSVISNGGPDIAEGTITVVGERSDGQADITFSEAFGPVASGSTLKQWFDFTAPAVDSRVVVDWTATVEGYGDTTPGNNTATGATNVRSSD